MPLESVEAIVFANGHIPRNKWGDLVQSSEEALFAYRPKNVDLDVFEYCYCASKLLIAVHLVCMMVEEALDIIDTSTNDDQRVEQYALDTLHSMFALTNAVKHAGDTEASMEKMLISHIQERTA
jgi:hypothetical protein